LRKALSVAASNFADMCIETGRVHSVALVRNPTQIFNSLSLAQQKLNESELLKRKKIWVHKEMNIRDTLSDLRSGSTNLLFATSLVEEGVDVQACSFVVAFDGINSVKGYVQMKGRARQEDAKFFLLQDAIIEQKSQLNLSTARKMELRIQSIIEQRMKTNDSTVATARHKQSIDARALSESKELAAIEAGMYKVGEAVVDLHTAKSLLHRYYVSLPVEDLVRRKKSLLLAYLPAFDKDRLELPSHFPHAARTIVTPEKYKGLSRKEKEQILSLMAVVRLHCNGLLNDRLLPLTRKDMHDRILALMSEDGKGNDKIPRVLRFGNSFEATQAFHVYPLIQRGHLLSLFESQLKGDGHTLGLLSVDPISFSPATVNHREFGQMTLSLGEPTVFVCTPERCIILQKIFSILFNHRWSRRSQNIFYTFREESDFLTPIQPYFIGILSSTLKLDFDLMNCIISEAERNTQQRKDAASDTATRKEMPKPRIWSPTYSEFRQYVVVGPSGKTCREKFPNLIDGVESFSDYYQKKYGHVVQDDEPLFEARYLWTSYSSLQLDPGKVVDQPLHAPVFHSILLPPSLCFEAPLADGHIALLSLFLPQILFLFERNLIAEAFLRHCEHEAPKMFSYCRKVSIEKVVTILTAKSCNRDDNYDTCEWLGDAVLKLLLSDSLIKSRRQKDFVEFLHEGDLSMLRSGTSLLYLS
jgi:dsRNA-specific ribonuclease